MLAHVYHEQRDISPENTGKKCNCIKPGLFSPGLYLCLTTRNCLRELFLHQYGNGIFGSCRSSHYKTNTNPSIFIEVVMLFL